MSLSDSNNAGESKATSKLQLLSYLEIIVKWRRWLIATVVAAAVASITVSLLLPNWYKASASVLPPQQSDVLSVLGMSTGSASGSLLQSLASTGAMGLLNKQMGVYNYLAILNSRTVMEAVINKFNLLEEYDTPHRYMSEAVKELEKNVDFSVEDQGYLQIQVWDKSPQQAAAMANYFVELLNNISIDLGTRESRDVREFVGQQLDESRNTLRLAEDSLRDYQERSGVIISPGEGGASFAAIAAEYAQKSRDEIQLAVLNKMVDPDFPTIKQLEMEIGELDARLAKVPQTGLRSLRLYRDVLIQEKIVEYLYPLFEKARIDEHRDIPAILVLDKAVPPERKSSPKRSIIVLLSVVGAFIFMFGLVLIRERINIEMKNNPENKERLAQIKLTIRGMFRLRK